MINLRGLMAAARLLVVATILLTFDWQGVQGLSYLPDYAVGVSVFNGTGCLERRQVAPFAVSSIFPAETCIGAFSPENDFANFSRTGVPGVLSVSAFTLKCDAQNPNGRYNFSVYPNYPSCSLADPASVPNARQYCMSLIAQVGPNYIGPASLRLGCVKLNCNPSYSMNKKTCLARKKSCQKYTVDLKWTGKGCKNPRTKRNLGDGGCQCDGYCGYHCKQACSKDRQCYWNTTSTSCWSKQTDLAPAAPGGPLPNCPLAPQQLRTGGDLLSYFNPA